MTASKVAFLVWFLGSYFGLTPPLQVLLGSHCVTHRWGHHLPSIRAQLCQDWSSGTWDNWLKLDLGGGSIVYKNWDKNGKKRLEIDKTILFHIHKHCTFSFTSKQPIFTSQQPILNSVWSLFCFKVANSKRKKRLQNSTKKVDLSLQDIKELPNALKGFYTLFYKFITQFYKQTAHFHSFWTKGSKFEAGKRLQKNKKRLEIAKTIFFSYTSIVQLIFPSQQSIFISQ